MPTVKSVVRYPKAGLDRQPGDFVGAAATDRKMKSEKSGTGAPPWRGSLFAGAGIRDAQKICGREAPIIQRHRL
jgi:hypothetical protein